MQVRSYKYRLRPNRAQSELLDTMLNDFCGLYNAALQQRLEAYRRRGKHLRYAHQAAELKACRAEDPDGLGRWSFSSSQQVLRRLDQTFAAFFRRRHGFPRFRASSRFHSASLRVGDGLSIKKDGRVSITGIPGGIKTVWHRDLPQGAKLGTAILSRKCGKWFVNLFAETEFDEACGDGLVGIDVGLSNLIATSDGETIEAPRFARKAQKARRRRQRALARCKIASHRRRKVKALLASSSAKIARRRRDHFHKLSRSLVSRYKGIAVEEITTIKLAKGRNARSVYDAGWSIFMHMIQYKAASAGAEFTQVDPSGTSQTCPQCGAVEPKTLKIRVHACACGCNLDRDVAAAMIIRARGFGPGHGLQSLSQRVAA